MHTISVSLIHSTAIYDFVEWKRIALDTYIIKCPFMNSY